MRRISRVDARMNLMALHLHLAWARYVRRHPEEQSYGEPNPLWDERWAAHYNRMRRWGR